MNTSTTTSNMSASIQQAIVENNAGTRFVRQCHYDSAVKSFTSVLKILKPLAEIVEDNKTAAAGGNNDNDNTTNIRDNTESDTESSSVPLTISFHNKAMDTKNNANDNDTTTKTPSRTASLSSSSPSPSPDTVASPSTRLSRKLRHFVFRDPIVIDESSSYSPELLSKFLMIVMYNLALTLHLHALSLASTVSSSSSSKIRSSKSMKHKIQKLFVRSKKLYELTLQMHLVEDSDLTSDGNDDPLFTLALTNNLGLIYRLLNERVQSTTCFTNMLSTMMYLLDCKFDSQSIKQWDGLFSNAMDILHKHTYEVAAAAA